MKNGRLLRLGTRGSRLALIQAGIVAGLVSRSTPGTRIEVVPIKTAGDAAARKTGPEADRKFAFTHEIDRRLAEGKIDFAVHSLKDVPGDIDRRLTIAAMPPRGDPRDALVTASGRDLNELPEGSAIGTGSLRRKVQLERLRPGLAIVEVRGNLETRIGKMRERGLEGVVLAAAGLERLGLGPKAAHYFTIEEMVPAACQGILGVVARRDDTDAMRVLKRIDDRSSRSAGECERAFLKELGGDCDFPVGAHGVVEGDRVTLVGLVAEPDGSSVVRDSISGPARKATELGARLARGLLENGAGLG